jgi:anti-sigma regulatory factor (Ser/Thr protein kinase)
VELREELKGDPSQVARARRLVGEALSQWGVDGDDCEVTVLLVSELVTNALLHSRPPFELRARREGDVLRVEMADADPDGWPVIRPTRQDVPGGRGLRLVESLATTWGTERDPRGKRVWFEVTLRGD